MADKVRTTCRLPKNPVGNANYTVIVDVTNVSDVPLEDVGVDVQVLPGRELSAKLPHQSELDELQQTKRTLVQELEQQVATAYERQNPPPPRGFFEGVAGAFAWPFLGYIGLLQFLINGERREQASSIPEWAREATRIEEWEDLVRLEKEVMSAEDPDSALRKFFEIDKEKLSRCLASLADVKNRKVEDLSLSPAFALQPGETMSFPFRYRAPQLMRQQTFEAQFRVSYKHPASGQGTVSVGETIGFVASPLAVPAGAGVGAVLGFVVRTLMLEGGFDWPDWVGGLAAAIALGVVVSLLTNRSGEHRKIIAVEDWLGGIVVGALTAIYSEEILEYLRGLLPDDAGGSATSTPTPQPSVSS